MGQYESRYDITETVAILASDETYNDRIKVTIVPGMIDRQLPFRI